MTAPRRQRSYCKTKAPCDYEDSFEGLTCSPKCLQEIEAQLCLEEEKQRILGYEKNRLDASEKAVDELKQMQQQQQQVALVELQEIEKAVCQNIKVTQESSDSACIKSEQINRNKVVVDQLKQKADLLKENLSKHQRKNAALLQLRKQMECDHENQMREVKESYEYFSRNEQKFYQLMKNLECEVSKQQKMKDNLLALIKNYQEELKVVNNKCEQNQCIINQLTVEIEERKRRMSHIQCTLERIKDNIDESKVQSEKAREELKHLEC